MNRYFFPTFRNVIPGLLAAALLGACASGPETAAVPMKQAEAEDLRAGYAAKIPLDPTDPVWQSTPAQRVVFAQFLDSMGPDSGAIDEPLTVKALNDGTEIYFLLEWADSTPDTTISTDRFADAVAVQFPFAEATGICMGIEGAPTNIWYWRADLEKPQSLTSMGIGSPQISPPSSQTLRHAQRSGGGRWAVLIARQMKPATENQVGFERGKIYPIAFSKWDGSHADRDGRKAYTDWYRLGVE